MKRAGTAPPLPAFESGWEIAGHLAGWHSIKIDVETDGDTWHGVPEHIPLDNQQDTALVSKGWYVIRFNTTQIHEQPVDYCVSKVMSTINRLGGLNNTAGVPVRYNPNDPLGPQQFGLFDRET